MGLLDGIIENAFRIDPKAAAQEYGWLLGHGEQVHAAYQLVRDAFLLSDRRLILVDKQGMTGRKIEYHTLRTGASLLAWRQPGCSTSTPN